MSNPRIVWIKIRDLYESKSMNRRLILKSQLYTLKMTDKMSIEEHLMSIGSIMAQLTNIRVVILDDELVDRALTSLLPSWDIFWQMVSGRENPPSFSELEMLLIQEDGVRTRKRDTDDEEAMALQYEAMYTGRPDFRNNCNPAQQPLRGRSNFGGNTFGRSGGRINNQWRLPAENNGGSRPQAARTSEPAFLGSEVNQRGTCYLCGNPYHLVDSCEIKHLRDEIREMKITSSGTNGNMWRRST
jgi:hypothetical protein